MKKIIVTGANGKMGQEVIRMISEKEDFELVGAVDVSGVGEDIHQILGIDAPAVKISDDLALTLDNTDANVLVDFTNVTVVMDNIKIAIEKEIDVVVGATGITEVDLDNIKEMNQGATNKIIIAPNFAIGAILMMQFAKQAAKFMDHVEIVELHHDRKIDAPSGTAIKTAELISENLSKDKNEIDQIEKIPGARGGEHDNIHIHSIRLPGLVAHQEVIFGGLGQTLTIRHDSINRKSFMPGVELAIRKLDEIEGVVYGLDNVIDL
ncbi:4-hydroxy-tetrahydrodipicolinate reductase [Orenia metallireducens]|jgi:4-hydroxy-tetrahydrodipicolinate reductase|uniref:4-hydroxy-tetrahydrodipicolinate reductase n=1 Tax=Orenia metallireducens TaxID=1413210 RepID=A0A1C0AA67_9FIRM|nr:4-hydroxy-tetrahydrodipicolinate reductase [Orenia metallireducens]OCL27153.1 4-hydroxy-tetrahydrodipicolinate reductase [Orenia metallireducens]